MPLDFCIFPISLKQWHAVLTHAGHTPDSETLAQIERDFHVSPQITHRVTADQELQEFLRYCEVGEGRTRSARKNGYVVLLGIFCAYAAGWNAFLDYHAAHAQKLPFARLAWRHVADNWERDATQLHGYPTSPALRSALQDLLTQREYLLVCPAEKFCAAVANGWQSCILSVREGN